MDICIFKVDPNFCNGCGAILPLLDQSNFIKCKGCGVSVDMSSLEGVEIHSYKNYNQDQLKSAEELSRLKAIKDEVEDKGPIVKRTCGKCGHKKMTYVTRQTRSADEGQTVFYTCLKCNFIEQEYS